MLQLITTTGCRPDAFDLCQKWMYRQTYEGPVHWIIVDDGEEAQPIWFDRKDWTITIIRESPYWKPGDNTQHRNLLRALEEIDRNEPVVIIEDDDYYFPNWLNVVSRFLETNDLVGEKNAHYYNVKTRIHRPCNNGRHASLCSTAMKGTAIDHFESIVRDNDKFIDIKLWKTFQGPKRLIDNNYVVGIKGLPGRENIGIGKRLTGTEDTDDSIFQRLVGADIEFYRRFQ